MFTKKTHKITRSTHLQPIKEGLEDLTQACESIDSKISHEKGTTGITLPGSMSLGSIARTIAKYAEAEEAETVVMHMDTTQHFYTAGYNLQLVLKEFYGIDFASPKPGMFGDSPPRQYTFPLTATETATITIGQFELPDMSVETDMNTDSAGTPRLTIQITCKNMHKGKAEILLSHLLGMPNPWQGQCLIFDKGSGLRDVELHIPTITRDEIALNPVEDAAMQLFIDQIRNHERLKNAGIPFKRGILLHGSWGGGKTLAASVFMTEAYNNGITVIHERDWEKLKSSVALAKSMAPAVVFCEDIDQLDSRAFINQLDDASDKHSEVSIIVTTNVPKQLDPALTRKGRLDISIEFNIPMAPARRRILEINDCWEWNEDIEKATEGMTGSDLAEVSRRAQICAIANNTKVTESHIFSAASTMTQPPKHEPKINPAQQFAEWIFQNTGLEELCNYHDIEI